MRRRGHCLARSRAMGQSTTFYRELVNKRITVADLTTAYWLSAGCRTLPGRPRDYGLLRQVHAGGEAMSPEGLKAWREAGALRCDHACSNLSVRPKPP